MTKPKKKPDARKAEVRRLELEVLRAADMWLQGRRDAVLRGVTDQILTSMTMRLRTAKARAGE